MSICKHDLSYLEELTNKLPQVPSLSEIAASHEGKFIEYQLDKGRCTGVGIFKDEIMAIQKAFMPKGSLFQTHVHSEKEFIILYKGYAKIVFQNQVLMKSAPNTIWFPANEPHAFEALEDCYMVAVLINGKHEGYPDA